MKSAITIKKSDNVGNTFDGLVATAFPGSKMSHFEINQVSRNCGTVRIDGVDYDWLDCVDSVRFMVAE